MKCIALIKNGSRNGEVCHCRVEFGCYCKRHQNENILCIYDPPIFQYNVNELIDSDGLISYVNLRIGRPLFKEPITLCFISSKKPQTDKFTKCSLAKEIFDEIEWMLKYGVGIDSKYSIDNIQINNISFNPQLNVHELNYSIDE